MLTEEQYSRAFMKPPFELRPIEDGIKGKVAIITGGTMGIGKACVRAFVWAGARVVMAGRSVDLGNEIAGELTQKGPGTCDYVECDVSVESDLQKLVDYTVGKYSRIDILVNCAGYFPKQLPIDEVPVSDFTRILATNLVSYYALSRFALPYLRTSRGNIVNIGSVIGTTGDEGAATYCATKGGIEAMTKSLAVDEARHGVRVNEIKPGHICNEMFAKTTERQADPEKFLTYSETLQWLGRGGSSDEVATAVLFMASEWASFITGASLMVTGGFEFGEGTKKPLFNWTTMAKK
jgi:NAD(P)-dependent dehydrogenase (short-subunit alcohol dehydrogenase family)